MKKIVFLGVLVVCLFSCKKDKIEHIERAFYYWKSSEGNINEKEQQLLDTLKIKKLYVKFFEVEYNETMGNIPISKTGLNEYSWYSGEDKKSNIVIIPTVFIKNEVFIKSSKSELDTLVSNVYHLVSKYQKDKFADYQNELKEVQFDCDWTIKSKDNYFYFLREFKKKSNIDLSCTLRLYPYKYRTKMGIPPVQKVTLMCYNLIQPFEDNAKNSILEVDELKSYLTVKEKYPLHLDVALPVFSWAHLYQYDTFKGFVSLTKKDIHAFCTQKNNLWYEVKKDTVVKDRYYRIGDKIKFEEVNEQKINNAIDALKDNIAFDKTTTITLFHLDFTNLTAYNYETLDKLYTSFSN